MSNRGTLADPGLRGTILVGLVVGGLGLWAWWDRTTAKVDEFREVLWLESGPIGVGMPAEAPARYRVTTRDGHTIEVAHVDLKGVLVATHGGAVQRLIRHADGTLSEIQQRDVADKLLATGAVETLEGVMTVRWTDGSGAAAANPNSGAWVEEHRFGRWDRLSEVRYFDDAGAIAAANERGVFGIRITRDTLGRPVEHVHLGPKRVPAADQLGVVTRAMSWHADGWALQREQFLDRDGAPTAGPLGCATRTWSEQGEPLGCLGPDKEAVTPHSRAD